METVSTWRERWRLLTEPAAGIQGEGLQQARLLANLSLALLLIAPLVISTWVLTSPEFVAARAISVGIIVLMAAIYGLSRSRHHRVGAYLLIVLILAIVAATVISAPGPMVSHMLALKFLMLAIMLASMLLPLSAMLLVVAISVGGTLWFVTLPEVPFAITYSYLVFELVLSALLIVSTTLHNHQVAVRRQATAALYTSEERFRRLSMQSPDTIYILNMTTYEVEFINREEFLGYSLAELRQPGLLLSRIAPEDQGRVRETWDELRLRVGGGAVVSDYRIRRKDDAWEWVQQRGILLSHAPTGTPAQILVVLTVITERKHFEEQVIQAQKMEAIGRLAGGIAHDFNNLLTVMNGYADFMLTAMADDDPLRGDVAEIAAAGSRAAALTRQLLTFSRQSLREVTSVSLNTVVGQAESILRRVIGENIALEVALEPEDWYVRADPDQLGQVLLNLAVNARDAMPQGGTLTIETRQEMAGAAFARARPGLAPGPHVILCVSDTGCGMSPEVRARVFEPFFTTKGPGGGTGLGLSVVHGIVAQSGGAIEIESEPGRGTVFQVILPALPPDEPPPAALGQEAAAPRGSETVLLVEDDEAVRLMARRCLERQGYQVLATTSGDEALRLMAEAPGQIDLVLTDVVMPGLSGPELIVTLRRDRPKLRAIYMSGYAPDTTLRHGMVEGVDSMLLKPFPPEALARRVREALDR